MTLIEKLNELDALRCKGSEADVFIASAKLAPGLSMVARAAMARREAIAALRGGVFNESNYRDLQTAKSRVEYCDAKLDAALDALEAAAEGVL